MAPDGQIAIGKVTVEVPAGAPSTVATTAAGSALRWSALICVSVAGLLWLGPYLWRVDLVSEDAAQHIFWLWRFVDPALLANDPAADYFGSLAVAPAGYRAIYAVLAPAFGPQLAGELVAAALIAISGVLAWMLGTALGNDKDRARCDLLGLLAVVATLGLIAITRSDLLSPMGFQRAFALPVTLLALWALVSGRYAWVGVAWLLAALFYPVILPVLGLAGAGVFLLDLVSTRRMPRAWLWNAVAGVAAISLVLFSAVPLDWVGPQVTLDQARAMPEFGAGGRLDLESHSWSFWTRDHRFGIGWPPSLLLAFVAAAALAHRLGGARAIPRAAWIMAASGLGLWAISHLTLFHLYLPNRHTRTSIAAFGVVAIAVALYSLMTRIGARSAGNEAVSHRRTGRLLAVCAPLVVGLTFLPTALQAWQSPLNPDLERMYDRIMSLPPETIIATHPDLADFIPLRTGRAVLASSETALPFMPGYYARMKPRMEASFRAAYAEDWDTVTQALEPYAVDVVLLGPPPVRRGGYPPPFDAFVRSLAPAGPTRDRVLRNVPPEQILLRSGEYFLIRLRAPAPSVVQAQAMSATTGGSAR